MHYFAYVIEHIEQIKALGDETRLRIFRILARSGGGLCVCELEAILGKPQYAVSRALGVLRKARLVAEERNGRLVMYRTKTATEFAGKLADAASSIRCADVENFAEDLAKTKEVIDGRVEGSPTGWCGCKA
jgi:ArsR family transcriptional regulator